MRRLRAFLLLLRQNAHRALIGFGCRREGKSLNMWNRLAFCGGDRDPAGLCEIQLLFSVWSPGWGSRVGHGGGPRGFQDPLFYFLVLGFDKLPLWGILLISAGSAVVCALVVWFFVCPRMKKKIERKYRRCAALRAGLLSAANLITVGLFLAGICGFT